MDNDSATSPYSLLASRLWHLYAPLRWRVDEHLFGERVPDPVEVIQDQVRRLSWYLWHVYGQPDGPDATGLALMVSGHELTKTFEPARTAREVRTASVVGLRNSLIEDAHAVLDPMVLQYFCKAFVLLTDDVVTACRTQNTWPTKGTDPYANLEVRYPRAIAALSRAGEVLDSSRPCVIEYEKIDGPLPALPTQNDTDGHWGFASQSVPRTYVQSIEKLCSADGGGDRQLLTPTFKHVSRDIDLLARILEILLAHNATFRSTNYEITNGRVVVRGPLCDVGHLRRDSAFTLFHDPLGWPEGMNMYRELRGVAEGDVVRYRKPVATPRRNDPCFCGSGAKFKRCCGAVSSR